MVLSPRTLQYMCTEHCGLLSYVSLAYKLINFVVWTEMMLAFNGVVNIKDQSAVAEAADMDFAMNLVELAEIDAPGA